MLAESARRAGRRRSTATDGGDRRRLRLGAAADAPTTSSVRVRADQLAGHQRGHHGEREQHRDTVGQQTRLQLVDDRQHHPDRRDQRPRPEQGAAPGRIVARLHHAPHPVGGQQHADHQRRYGQQRRPAGGGTGRQRGQQHQREQGQRGTDPAPGRAGVAVRPGQHGQQVAGQQSDDRRRGQPPCRRHPGVRQQQPGDEHQTQTGHGAVEQPTQPHPGRRRWPAGQAEQAGTQQGGGAGEPGGGRRRTVPGGGQRQHRRGQPGGHHRGVQQRGGPAGSGRSATGQPPAREIGRRHVGTDGQPGQAYARQRRTGGTGERHHGEGRHRAGHTDGDQHGDHREDAGFRQDGTVGGGTEH